ncbi:hypothetical protein HY78_02185 [Rhizorhabdus wittichii DC-6]|nr:hypothetical protein HY78_02185 [Rhizorhabdus wittichii DC-6]
MENIIRRYRQQAGISVSELARRTGVSAASASAWDRGLSQPRNDMRQRIANALGVEASDIWEEFKQRRQKPEKSAEAILLQAKAALSEVLGLPQHALSLELRIIVGNRL